MTKRLAAHEYSVSWSEFLFVGGPAATGKVCGYSGSQSEAERSAAACELLVIRIENVIDGPIPGSNIR